MTKCLNEYFSEQDKTSDQNINSKPVKKISLGFRLPCRPLLAASVSQEFEEDTISLFLSCSTTRKASLWNQSGARQSGSSQQV